MSEKRYRTIMTDPPWPLNMVGESRDSRPGRVIPRGRSQSLSYPTMSVEEICNLDIQRLAASACHLWLWTTNRFLEPAFGVMRSWGFTYLTTITWVKPAGLGAWFASTTQHCLFGYYEKCVFPGRRYAPTHFNAVPKRHSEKPEAFLDLVEQISPEPRIELFARRNRFGWDTWGNECLEHVEMDGAA